MFFQMSMVRAPKEVTQKLALLKTIHTAMVRKGM
jgi:hypothetical protein